MVLLSRRQLFYIFRMEVLELLLNARTERQTTRNQVAKGQHATISFNFNVAGFPKSTPEVKEAFLLVRTELLNFLIASRVPVMTEKGTCLHNAAGDMAIFPLRHTQQGLSYLKEMLEKFEMHHPLNRLLDVDLFNEAGEPVSSGKKKPCLICKDRPALVCMREQRHTHEEFRHVAFGKIRKFLQAKYRQQITRKLTSFATQALLMEVSLPDKPGLVCPATQGAHNDMNYFTFLQSTAALSPFFMELAKLGCDWDGICCGGILQQIRLVGINMESAMNEATRGINTQKGIIFLMGFSVFAAAHVLSGRKEFCQHEFREIIMLLNQDLVARELLNGWNQNASHGEKCFNRFGKEFAGGIRREVELGLPTIFDTAIPLMAKLFPKGLDTRQQDLAEEKLTHVLLALMAVNNDTNILFRKDLAVLIKLKEQAQEVLHDPKGMQSEAYQRMKSFCLEQHISPGGSADLLAISIFIYQLAQNF